MDHLLNCHGEWMMILSSLSSLPVVGFMFRARLAAWRSRHAQPAAKE